MRKKFEYVILLLAVLGVLVANNELRANDTHDYGFYWFDANNQSTDAVNSSGVPNTVSTAFYDPAKPTVFYFHGWQKGTSVKSYSRETFLYADPTTKTNVNTVAKWKADGWNVAIFYWNQMADEDEVKDAEAKIWSTSGPKGMRYRISTGAYGTAFTPTKSVGALALAEYTGQPCSAPRKRGAIIAPWRRRRLLPAASALGRAGVHRQAALEPAGAGGAAGHAFPDILDIGEADALQAGPAWCGCRCGRSGRSARCGRPSPVPAGHW
jgi:hypothetical protein